MKFGNVIRTERERKGWTQPEAAQKIQIEQSYLSKLETGKSVPSEDVYQRLLAIYDLDSASLFQTLSPSERERLAEIQSVGNEAVADHARRMRARRRWMIAGVASLFFGGFCLGLTKANLHNYSRAITYYSPGVLAPDEPLDAFDVVRDKASFEGDREEVIASRQNHLDRQRAMTARLDEIFRQEPDRGRHPYIENVDGGRRYFEPVGDVVITRHPVHASWFFAPAAMGIIGSLGCFFAAFRWR